MNRPNPMVLNEDWGRIRHDQTPRLSLLVYGRPGTGKTSLAATAADDEQTSPVLYMDADRGTIVVSHRTQGLEIHEFDEFSTTMNWLVWRLSQEHPFKTVVVDSLTEVTVKAMANVLATAPTRRTVPGVPEYADWNILTNKMRQMLALFRDLPVHFIATAQEQEDENNKVFPDFPGKRIRDIMPGYFSTLARLSIASVPGADGKMTHVRRLTLQAETRVEAKDRSDPAGLLPREMDNPTIHKLLLRAEQGRAIAAKRLETEREQASNE